MLFRLGRQGQSPHYIEGILYHGCGVLRCRGSVSLFAGDGRLRLGRASQLAERCGACLEAITRQLAPAN